VTSLFAAVRSPTSVSCGWDGGLSCFLTSPVCGQRSLFSVSNPPTATTAGRFSSFIQNLTSNLFPGFFLWLYL